MQIFKDAAGAEWQIDLNIQTAREIRRYMAAHADSFANVDFLDYATLLFSLNDIFFAADLLAIVCAKQREERQLDEAAFGALLRGKVLFDAIEAFTAEYLDFFPDPTTAEKMRAVVEKNKKAPARYKADADYILTTKLYCGKCKSFMVGESGTSRNANTYRYYKCITAKRKKGCDKKAVKKDWIEEIVINQIKKIIFDDALMEAIADRVYQLQDQENSTVPLLKKQLAETEKGIENVLNAIEQGIITPSTKHRLQELEQRKQDLQIEIAKENIKKPIITKEQILFWLHRFRNIDTDNVKHRKRLVDSFVNSIVLYDDRIEFFFNYKEGAKTLTLEELSKSSDLLASPPPSEKEHQLMFLFEFARNGQ